VPAWACLRLSPPDAHYLYFTFKQPDAPSPNTLYTVTWSKEHLKRTNMSKSHTCHNTSLPNKQDPAVTGLRPWDTDTGSIPACYRTFLARRGPPAVMFQSRGWPGIG
jgi:hypothetical protein